MLKQRLLAYTKKGEKTDEYKLLVKKKVFLVSWYR